MWTVGSPGAIAGHVDKLTGTFFQRNDQQLCTIDARVAQLVYAYALCVRL
jgi:hypothetical protein